MILASVAVLLAGSPPITAGAFTPDGRSVLVGSRSGVEVRSWPELATVRVLPIKVRHVHDLAFSPQGNGLAVAGGSPAIEGVVELLSWPEGQSLFSEATHDDVVHAVAFNPDGRLWATAGADGSVQIHDSGTHEVIHDLSGHSQAVLAVGFVDDTTLVSAGVDQTLRVWDVRDGRLIRSMDNHTQPIHALATRPSTNPGAPPMVASVAADRTLRLWQPTIGRLVRFVRLESIPLAVAWTPDGRTVLVACQDGRLRGFDPETLASLIDTPTISGWVYTLQVAPLGRAALVGGEQGGLKAVDLPSPRR